MDATTAWFLAHGPQILVGVELGVGAITLGVVARYVGRRGWNAPLRTCTISGVVLILAGVAAVTHVETVWPRVDFVFWIAALCAYCVVAFAAWWIRPRALGVPAGIILSGPLLFVLPFLPIIIMFNIDDAVQPPVYEERIRPGVSCRAIQWGNFAQYGHSVILDREVPFVPFLRVEIARQPEFDAYREYWPPAAGCAKFAAEMLGKP